MFCSRYLGIKSIVLIVISSTRIIFYSHYCVEKDYNLHVCGTWTDNKILSETAENTSDSEDEPQNEEEVTFEVTI